MFSEQANLDPDSLRYFVFNPRLNVQVQLTAGFHLAFPERQHRDSEQPDSLLHGKHRSKQREADLFEFRLCRDRRYTVLVSYSVVVVTGLESTPEDRWRERTRCSPRKRDRLGRKDLPEQPPPDWPRRPSR